MNTPHSFTAGMTAGCMADRVLLTRLDVRTVIWIVTCTTGMTTTTLTISVLITGTIVMTGTTELRRTPGP
jgi:hypothetical protein